MIATLDAAALDRFRGLIAQRLGLLFDDTKLAFLADVLRQRLEATHEEVSQYLSHLDTQEFAEELTELGQLLTVSETYFFRHAEQYRAFAEHAFPDRWSSAQREGRNVSIVSAGCASGEEAYSLAITVRDTAPAAAATVSILGLDINPTMIDKARRGRYSAWVLRETPSHTRRGWFHGDGKEFTLDNAIRESVRFGVSNLAAGDAPIWRRHSHDVVFCRNVLMYFEPNRARALIAQIAGSLRPGGYLFLGHAETLRGLSNDFHLLHTHDTFYYQLKDGTGSRVEPRTASAVRASIHELPPLGDDWVANSPTWIDTIARASKRIQSLAESRRNHRALGAGSNRHHMHGELAVALELLREERFAEALEVLALLPPDVGSNHDILLLRAVLLTHSGQLDKAKDACARLLEIDELTAEGHYLLALCREGEGDADGAVYHDQIAVYLDSSFAMAHLHLAVMAQRTNDAAIARREFEQAILLLRRENPSRVLLFGGGFTREGLVGLCRSQLARLGCQA